MRTDIVAYKDNRNLQRRQSSCTCIGQYDSKQPNFPPNTAKDNRILIDILRVLVASLIIAMQMTWLKVILPETIVRVFLKLTKYSLSNPGLPGVVTAQCPFRYSSDHKWQISRASQNLLPQSLLQLGWPDQVNHVDADIKNSDMQPLCPYSTLTKTEYSEYYEDRIFSSLKIRKIE